MADKGVLFIVSGFAGAGKGTVTKQVVKEDENIKLSISATTRDMRKGEAEGVDYFYITKEEFEQKIKNRELLEYAKYGDNYYGTPRDYVKKMLEEGKDVLLEIEVLGAAKIKASLPKTVRIFVTPPSAKMRAYISSIVSNAALSITIFSYFAFVIDSLSLSFII